jgi:hypothetical protein
MPIVAPQPFRSTMRGLSGSNYPRPSGRLELVEVHAFGQMNVGPAPHVLRTSLGAGEVRRAVPKGAP